MKSLVAVLLLLSPAWAQEATGPVSLHITNFGNGMTPVLPSYRNDPEAITLSQNFYSLQPGGRQLRHGYVELVDSTSAAAAAGVSGVDALVAYAPAVGERKLMYAIGGKWLYGDLDTSVAKITTAVLVPFLTGPTGDKLNWNGDSAWYTLDRDSTYIDTSATPDTNVVVSLGAARFLEHLQVGDTLSFGPTLPTTHQRRIRWIIDNKKVKFTSGGLTLDSGNYTVRRWYHNDSAIQPFYYQYGDDLFTGTKRDRPQVIYPIATNQYAIRPAGIADSVHVDAIYFKFGGDTNAVVRSYDTASDGREYIWLIQVVDRNKAWLSDVWSAQTEGASETFYFRFGTRAGDSINAMTYRIYGNTDTSLFLASVFVDTNTNRNFCDTTARYKADSTDFAGFTGGHGYIFSTAGNFKTVHAGSGGLRIYGGGAVLVTPDSLHRDSLFGTGGMYFVRPLQDVSIAVRKFLGFRFTSKDYPCGTSVTTPPGWTLTKTATWFDRSGNCITRYSYKYPVSGLTGEGFKVHPGASRYQAVNKFTFFPVLDIDHKRDSMFIRTGLSFDPGATNVAITSWEIVRADLPMWSGISEFGQQLYAWGDTTAPGTISQSKANVPGALGVHAWSASDDILVGDNPSEAVVSAAGYDDQLIAGLKDALLTTTNGVLFGEMSKNIGVSSQRGLFAHNKEFLLVSDDGVYYTARRDLSGHTVQKISTALDPVFNKWGATEYGPNVVPFTLNRALIDQTILTFNKRDQHFYLFFAEGTATYNNRCLTYNWDTKQWDGYFTFGAGAAISASFHDTTRLIFGSPTGPVIYAYDYNYSDAGTAITGEISGAPFYFADRNGWPVTTKIGRVRLFGRSTSASVDTVQLILTGDAVADTFLMSYSAASVADSVNISRPSGDRISVNWKYKLRVKGKAAGGIYQPHSLDIDFVPFGGDD